MTESDTRFLGAAIRNLKRSFDEVESSSVKQEDLMNISREEFEIRTAKERGRLYGMLEFFFEVPEVQTFFKEA